MNKKNVQCDEIKFTRDTGLYKLKGIMYNHLGCSNVQNDSSFWPMPKIGIRFNVNCTKLATKPVITLTLRPEKGIFNRKTVDPDWA